MTRQEALSLLADFIEAETPELQSAKLYDLLRSCYGVGPGYARMIIKNCGLGYSTTTRIQSLSPVRRDFVCACLRRNGMAPA